MTATVLWIMLSWASGVLGFVLGAAWAGNRKDSQALDRAVRRMYTDNMEDNGNDYRH